VIQEDKIMIIHMWLLTNWRFDYLK